MQTRNYSNVVWLLVFITILSSFTFSQQKQLKIFEIEDVQTTIQNIQSIVEVEKEEGDTSSYVYIIKTNDKILFCDKNYNSLKAINIIPNETQILLSKKSRYVITREYLNVPESKLKVRFTLFDYQGKIYWSREEEVIYDVSDNRVRVISDVNGSLFELDVSTTLMKITDTNGNVTEISLFDDAPVLEYRFQSIDISKNGEYIAVCINKQAAIAGGTIQKTPVRGPNKGKEQIFEIEEKDGEPYILLFNYKGKLLRQKREDLPSVSSINISDDGSRIACSFYTFENSNKKNSTDKTRIYDNQFKQIASLDFMVRDIVYDNGTFIAIGPRHLIAYDIKSNTKLYSAKLTGKSMMLSKIIVDDKDCINVITRSGSQKFANLYDNQGKFMKEISLGELRSNTTVNLITEKILLRSNTIATDGKIRKIK